MVVELGVFVELKFDRVVFGSNLLPNKCGASTQPTPFMVGVCVYAAPSYTYSRAVEHVIN